MPSCATAALRSVNATTWVLIDTGHPTRFGRPTSVCGWRYCSGCGRSMLGAGFMVPCTKLSSARSPVRQHERLVSRELGSVKSRVNTSVAHGYKFNPLSFHQSFLLSTESNRRPHLGLEPASAILTHGRPTPPKAERQLGRWPVNVHRIALAQEHQPRRNPIELHGNHG